ncbi:MAG: recombinase family protein [Patescibacteria group bacterium]
MAKYILYARKSTDEEERQVLSIDAQLAELKEFAVKEKLEIVTSLCEAKTAKQPGRTVFGEMLRIINSGKADGILAWHPDRLARNPIDGGQIIYLVDTGKINSLKFPTFWFENTPQGKFMLNIAFGQSKYFIDNLSENVKRGLRQKLRRGECPGRAPFGYLNDLKNHTMFIDKTKHKLVKRIFELYATGEYPLKVLAEKFNDLGLRTQSNSKLSVSVLQSILKNPFYSGVFKYNGELHEGKHEPMITKKLFDEVQTIMQNRGRPHKIKKHEYIFCSLMKCGSCGCYITAERQKGHVYYRCTKKIGTCEEKYIREEALAEQLKEVLQKVSLPDDLGEQMLAKLDNDAESNKQASSALVVALEGQITAIKGKMDKLLDSHLDSTIDKADYLTKKEKLLNQKMVAEGKLKEINNKGANWLEPMREFILSSCEAKKIARAGDLNEIRTFLKNVGSNFTVKGKKFEFLAKRGWRIFAEKTLYPTWLRD